MGDPPPAGPQPPTDVEPGREHRSRRGRQILDGLLAALAVASGLVLVEGQPTPFELAEAALVASVIGVILYQRRVGGASGRRRAARARSFTRILQGLSRSVSSESVVEAIIEELRSASGADHVVVARQMQPDGSMEVTVMAASPTVPTSKTFLRPDILGDPVTEPGAGSVAARPVALPAVARVGSLAIRFQEAADEVARRVRSGYGLPYTLAAPLVAQGRFVGALILSKRTRSSWSDVDRRLLTWAAGEVSAAFVRAYALEAAEARANIDALTGLPNRRYLDELISIVPQRRRTGDSLGALMIDIDRFKRLNDKYGHATGDSALRAVAGAIYVTIRAEDTPARYGGEEFAVILRRASATQAMEVGERIRAAVAAIPPERIGIGEPVTVSVGVAVAGEDEQDVRGLLERADRALFLAKRRGRDRVETA